jgi:two-component system LytT family response regulator
MDAAREFLAFAPVRVLLVLRRLEAARVSEAIERDKELSLAGVADAFPLLHSVNSTKSPEALIVDEDLIQQDRMGIVQMLSVWGRPPLVVVVREAARAVEAFRLGAVDCLVRPIESVNIRQSLDRIREVVMTRRAGYIGEKMIQMVDSSHLPAPVIGRIPLRSAGRISFVRTEDVDWLEAQGDYVCLHCCGKKHLIRGKISMMEQQLPVAGFARIHRSTIVNLNRIKELQPLSYGDYSVVLTDGTRLALSRSYRPKVLDLLTGTRHS